MNSIRLSSLNAPVSGVFRLVSLLCLALPLLAAPAREVAFVDGAVAGHEALVAGVRPGVETVRLDPAGDALAQMAAWAETHSGYEAIHVVSHAAPGALRLGGASLDGAALRDPAVAGRLARLGRALNRGGDLLLYGCELAKGEAGARFVAAVAQVAGVDVAASDDKTGAVAKGGDWALEVAAGTIEARSLVLGDFQGVLSTITFLVTDGDVSGMHSTITRTETGSQKTITFAGASGRPLMGGSDSNGDFGLSSYGFDGTGAYLKITAPAGSTFDLTSFAATISGGPLSITLTYGDGQQSSFTHSGSGTTLSTQSGFTTLIADVTAVEISSFGDDVFNDFAISDVKTPPTFSGSFTGELLDTAAADSFGNLTGTLTATPVGTATIVSFGLTDGTSGTYDVGGSSYDMTKAGGYGTLYLNSSTGVYVYVPNTAAIEALSTEFSAGATQRVTMADIFAVTATDSVGATAEATGLNGVYISITGQNDRPEITSGTTVNVVEHSTGTVYTATASDRDSGQTLTYSLDGDDAGLFNIDPNTRAVSFKAAPDFEAPADSDHNNVYDIAITATDDALVPNAFSSDPNYNKSAPQAVTITVTDDTTAPAVATIARIQAGPVTTANTLVWRVTSTEAVTGVDLADFELTPVDGAATATLGTVTAGANAAEYFVTATGVAGTGTLRLDVKASAGITDVEGYALAGGFTQGQSYTHVLGTVPVAWGYNLYGRLGLGTTDSAAHPLAAFVTPTGALAGKTVVAVASGFSHTLALDSDGKVYAWGDNSRGRLGIGSTTASLVPVAVNANSGSALSGKKVMAIAAGSSHSLALCDDGTVVAWGYNNNGQVGDGSNTERLLPVAVAAGSGSALYGKTVVAITAGGSHSLALCSDGTVVSWGGNVLGQLGNGTLVASTKPVAVATDGGSALSGKTVTALGAGQNHSLALCSDGTVVAWGANGSGQLGNGTMANASKPVAVATDSALSGKTIVAIASGDLHSLALSSDGLVFAWGENGFGRLGDGTTVDATKPVAVALDSESGLSGKTVVAIAAGESHNLALSSDGTLTGWGANTYGRLGDGTTANATKPVTVNRSAADGSALVGRVAYLLSPGSRAAHSVALASPAKAIAVATPAAGTYKAGDTLTFALTPPLPVTVTGTPRLVLTVGTETRYATYASGSGSTSLVFTYTVQAGDNDTDGIAVVSSIDLNGGTLVESLGLNLDPALPAYTLPVIRVDNTPPAVPTIGAVTATTVSGTAEPGATVEVFNGGTSLGVAVADAEGHWSLTVAPLRNGTYSLTAMATDAAGNVSAASSASSWIIDMPAVATIARTQAGPVTLAETLEWRVTFTEAVTGVDLADFALTSVDGAATATLGTVTAGANAAEYFVTATGVAGVGTLRLDVKSSGTGIVDGESNALSGGFIHGQPYTRTLGTVPVAWGFNYNGQLGLGTTDSMAHPVPALVPSTGALAGKTVVAVSAGTAYTLALSSDGKVSAWGFNGEGQLGNDSTTESRTPVAVIADQRSKPSALDGKTVVAVSAAYQHSLALCSDGTVAAWGFNGEGQLGNDSTPESRIPVAVIANQPGTPSALDGKTVVAVSAGAAHSLALCSDGTVVAWGRNNYGQLGNNTSTGSDIPVAVDTTATSALFGRTVVAVSAGNEHSLALCSDGTVAAWGENDYGRLGNGSTADSRIPVAVIANQPGKPSALDGKTVVAVSAGFAHSLALCSDGTVVAWGRNKYGQLGNNTLTDSDIPVAVDTTATSALEGKPVAVLAAGSTHSLVLCRDGTTVGWGVNSNGQLGNGTNANSSTPVAVTTSAPSALVGKAVYALGSSWYAYHCFALASPAKVIAVAAPAAGTYKAGDTLSFTLTTEQSVNVTGTPRLALTIGTVTRYATYASGSGTTSPVFTYTVADGETDADGLAVVSTSIDLAGGTITAAGGWSIALALPAYTLPVIAIDTTPPAVPTITSTAPVGTTTNSAYTLTGTAEAGATVKIYNAGTLVGTATADADGHWSCALTLDDGATALTVTATDAAGNVSTAATDASWTIDTTAPEVATIARTQPGPVTLDETLEWRVTFTEPVTGVDLTDFELTSVDGAATATLATVTVGTTAAEFLVTATDVSGIGTLRLDAKKGGTGITDALGHVMMRGYVYGQSYTHARGTVPVVLGNNNFGQLGLGFADGTEHPIAHPLPAFVPNTGALAGKTVVALSVGGAHTLALTSEGKVYAWGNNVFGQLGNGSTGAPLVTPVEVVGLGVPDTKTVVAISAGSYHSVALDSDGHVYSWGYNNSGQLGNDLTTDSSTPVAVNRDGGSALSDKRVVAISAGNQFTLALCRDGTLVAWGFNNNGQLGNGTMANARIPVAVATGSGSALKGKTVVAMAAGVRHSAALCSDGTVATWGNNNNGQLGNGTRDYSSTPVAVNMDSGSALHGKTVVAISAGSDFMLALCDDGTRAVWGYNNKGQLGNGTVVSPVITPVAVDIDSDSALYRKTVVALAAGSSHSLALRADGTLATWGLNNAGQLGDGAVAQVSTPKAINDPLNPVAGSALLGRTPYLLAPGCYAYHSAVLVSATPVSAVATPAAGSYKAGDSLTFTLTTGCAATVTGSPRLALKVGTATVYATYVSGSGSTSLVFTYTVVDGDTDAAGLAVAGTIDLNGGTITDASSWSIALALPAYTLPVISVDAIAPAQLTAFDAVATGAGQIELTFTAPEDCTVYFTALEASQTAGTAAQIVAGQDAAANPVRHGSLALAAGGPGTYTLKGLAAGTAYTVHATVADAAGNVAVASPLVATATTAAAPSLTGMDWSQMTLDALCGEDPQLAFAPDGTPYVAFQSTVVSGKLLVQRYVGGVWSPVGGTSGLSAGPAYGLQLAFAPDGTPYVAYSDNGLDNKAVVKRFTGGAWSAVGPDTGLSYGEVTTLRLAFAPDGTPWLAYSDNTLSDKAVVRRYEQGEWIAVGSGTGVTDVGAATLDLVFGLDGTAHLAFRNSAESGRPAVWFWSEASAAWLTGDTTASLPAVDRVHLAAAPDGTLYLAYRNSSDDKVGVARHDAASWTQIGDSQPASTWLDLAVGADGVPFLCYRKGALGSGYRAYVSTYVGAKWIPDPTGAAVAAGEVSYPSLQVAPDGVPYVVCRDDTTNKVMVSRLVAAVTSVGVPGNGTYGAGQTLAFTVNYSGPVSVTGTPRLPLTIGSMARYADYTATGSTSTALRFLYTVQAGDLDPDGVAVGAALDLDGGTIIEASGWNAGITLRNVAGCSGIKIDTVAPDTTITSHPANPSASASATFTFGSSDGTGVGHFEASLDGSDFATATSPASLTSLADGSHTFAVRAIDAAGNVDTSPAAYTWTIDTTAPEAPAIGAVTPTTVSGTAEPGATVEVFSGSTSLGTATADVSGNWSLTIPPLADGTYSLTATATDALGNTGTASAAGSWKIDTVAPTLSVVTLVSTNAAPTLAKAGDTLTLSFAANETIQTPTVSLAGELATAAFDSVAGTWSATHSVSASDTEGVATFSITFRDLAGNTGTAVTATTDSSAVTIDLTGPETTFDGTPGAWSGSRMAMFDFIVGSGVAGYQASLDGAAYAPILNPAFFNDLADGPHTLAVRAIDAAGNVDATPAIHSWTVDTIAPSTPSIASIMSIGVSGTAEPGSTVRVYDGATLLGTATADVDGNWSLAHPLADGSYSLTATSRDAAGNSTSTTAPTTRTVDTVKPTLTVVTLLSDNAHDAAWAGVGDTVALSFTASEAIQAPTVTLVGETVTAAFDSATGAWLATHTVAAGDTQGVVAFSVAFRDLAGNTGTAVTATTDSSAVTIDRTAPDTAITSQPASLSTSRTATFAFSGSDASGSGVVSFEASLDGAAYAPATSPAIFTGLAEGAHTVAVRAIDAAGNVDASHASYTWTVDPDAPTAPAIVSSTSTSVSGTGEPGSTVRVYDGATLLGSATVGADGTWTISLGVLPGAHTLTATVTDSAGNTGAGQSFRFASTHSGDSDGDWRISLPELLWMVELFNTADGAQRTGAYHSAPTSAEGFAPGAGPLGYYHSSDTDRNGRLDLPELLRAIELYNAMNGTTRTGAYHIDSGSNDGFAAGAN